MSVDFPLLGGPAITTRTPSRNRSTDGAATSLPISSDRIANATPDCAVTASGTSSSSEKSSAASIEAATSTRRSFHRSIFWRSPPSDKRNAARR